jgi:hypothetical protein
MQNDPFEQFERSRGGLLIPVAIFVLGACLTWFAIGNLQPIVAETELADPVAEDPVAEGIVQPNENTGLRADDETTENTIEGTE